MATNSLSSYPSYNRRENLGSWSSGLGIRLTAVTSLNQILARVC